MTRWYGDDAKGLLGPSSGHRCGAWLLALLIGFLGMAGANPKPHLKVSKGRIIFTPSTKQAFYLITNDGDGIGYVNIDTYRIKYDGSTMQSIEKKNPKEFGLLVSPSKLILQPGQSKKVRVKRFKFGNKTEYMYEVIAKPVPRPREIGEETKKSMQTKTTITMAALTRVFLPPAKLDPQLTAKQSKKVVTFTNTGNTTMQVGRIQICLADNCRKAYAFELYPGMQKTLKLINTQEKLTYQYRDLKGKISSRQSV
jgi:P pilus assembly chaperone PapD